MEIRLLETNHIQGCAELLMQAYNSAPWDDQWSKETAERYLNEFATNPRFVGFIMLENNRIIGAAFCHEKTWWTNDELYVDEFYISPDFQRKGYGNILLQHLERYIKEKKLAGFTLLTNKYMPAVKFYDKNGFTKAEHVLFMYKEV